MKEAFYFSHDYNAQNDPKVENMMFDKGWAGYGLFWALIEKLAQESSHKMRTHYKRIGFALRTDEESIRAIVEDYELFTIEENMFFSKRLLSHFAEREEKSQKARESAQKKWSKEASKNANASKTHMRTPCEDDAIKERKGKERKEKERYESENTPANTMKDFIKMVSEKNNQYSEFVSTISIQKNVEIEIVQRELDKFVNYWTEKSQSGTHERWQKEKVFEVQRRLVTWFLNMNNFSKPNQNLGAFIS